MISRKGKPDPELFGVSITDVAAICNAIVRNGVMVEHDQKLRRYEWSALGIRLDFTVNARHWYNGYNLNYTLSGRGWHMEFYGSMYPPGNTVKGRGHFDLAPYDEVKFSYLPAGKNRRFIFGFRGFGQEGHQESYKHDMAIIKMMIPDFRHEEA